MMTDTEHSEHYYEIVETVQHPDINFMLPVSAEQRPEAIKQVLHNFVNHQYLQHELTEPEAEDLHQYINERSYRDA